MVFVVLLRNVHLSVSLSTVHVSKNAAFDVAVDVWAGSTVGAAKQQLVAVKRTASSKYHFISLTPSY